jgi:Zn-dependent peptidase ImmA (M78 family)
MDEAEVLWKARQFVAKLDTSNILNDLSVYTSEVQASVRYEELPKGESGYVIPLKDGKSRIVVNSLETEERQRFTICHEVAHLALALPSMHDEVHAWAYAKRDLNETWCDMFAAELLMPASLFKAEILNEDPSLELIEKLSTVFKTSFPATASRFAALSELPCAYVTMDRGIIRHAVRSTRLRNAGAWIAPRSPIPRGSVAHALRDEKQNQISTREVAQDIWFSEWEKGRDLWEMSRHYARFDQTVSLIWFNEEDLPDEGTSQFKTRTSADEGLSELTGELPWPGKSKRRR